jgi:glycosyltransferase involved in cell wall biosynthesis
MARINRKNYTTKPIKLIIQIPCFNEEKTLPLVIKSVPKSIKGVNTIETLIIDDGSTDKTVEVARKLGIDHIVGHVGNKGLAFTFAQGLYECLRQGADIIVNIDGDNEHPAAEIPRLVQPILDGTHDIVVANRNVRSIAHFKLIKKYLQQMGSLVVRMASSTDIKDAPCGFRAFSREAAMEMNLVTSFSYTLETIIQAGHKKIAATNVDIPPNINTRRSRLFKSIWQYVRRSAVAIIRSYAMQRPFSIFFASGVVVGLIGTIPYFRIVYLMLSQHEPVTGHIQSLILGAVFIILGVMFILIGIIADLLNINRKLTEDILYRMKKLELDILRK